MKLSFQIGLHEKDIVVLKMIQTFFNGIGNISKHGSHFVQFRVESVKDLASIINHFDNYPLITKKKSDFLLFKQIIEKMVEGEHLSLKGLQEIVNIRASMNLGLSTSFKTIFPNTIPVARPLIENITIPHPE